MKRYNIQKINKIYDPFIGIGSSFTNSEVKDLFGVDVSPFAINVSMSKLVQLTEEEIKLGYKFAASINNLEILEFPYPEWKPFFKYVNKQKYNIVKSAVFASRKTTENLERFISYLIFSNLEKIFDYKRDGNGIKYRKSKIKEKELNQFLKELIIKGLQSKERFDVDNNIRKIDIKLKSSTLNITSEKVNIVLTSPPYANMFDYFEVYKIELWTSEIIKSYSEWKKLKKSALRSNLNSDLNEVDFVNNSNLKKAISTLETRNVEKRTIIMLNNYFYDMKLTIKNIYESLEHGGYAFVVVGNSFYKGVPIPTDYILEELGKDIGFKVKDIIFTRKLNTSPQQMKIISENDKIYLRESILVLRKEKL